MNVSQTKKNIALLLAFIFMLILSMIVRFNREMDDFHKTDTPMETTLYHHS